MKHTVHKFFASWDFEKEERWLNEMSAKGLALTHVGFCKFYFEDGTPGEYIYRLELLNELPSSVQSRKYIEFLEDTGVTHVASYFRWAYFRKKASDGPFDLFSDIDSRVKYLNRLLVLFAAIGPSVFLIGAMNVFAYLNEGFRLNVILGVIDMFLGALLLYGFVNIYLKKRRMQKERAVRE